MKKILLGIMTITTLMFSRDYYNQYENHRNYDSYNNSYNKDYVVLMKLRGNEARNFLLDNQQYINYFNYRNHCTQVNENRAYFIERMFENTYYSEIEVLQDRYSLKTFVKVRNENRNEGFLFESLDTCEFHI